MPHMAHGLTSGPKPWGCHHLFGWSDLGLPMTVSISPGFLDIMLSLADQGLDKIQIIISLFYPCCSSCTGRCLFDHLLIVILPRASICRRACSASPILISYFSSTPLYMLFFTPCTSGPGEMGGGFSFCLALLCSVFLIIFSDFHHARALLGHALFVAIGPVCSLLLPLLDLCFSSQIPLDGPLCLFLSCSLIFSFLLSSVFFSCSHLWRSSRGFVQ